THLTRVWRGSPAIPSTAGRAESRFPYNSASSRPGRVSAALERCDASDRWLDTSSAPVKRPSEDRPLDRPRRRARAIDAVHTLAKRPWRYSLTQGDGPSAGAEGSLVVHGIAAEVVGGCQPGWLSPPPSDCPHSKGPSTIHVATLQASRPSSV